MDAKPIVENRMWFKCQSISFNTWKMSLQDYVPTSAFPLYLESVVTYFVSKYLHNLDLLQTPCEKRRTLVQSDPTSRRHCTLVSSRRQTSSRLDVNTFVESYTYQFANETYWRSRTQSKTNHIIEIWRTYRISVRMCVAWLRVVRGLVWLCT